MESKNSEEWIRDFFGQEGARNAAINGAVSGTVSGVIAGLILSLFLILVLKWAFQKYSKGKNFQDIDY